MKLETKRQNKKNKDKLINIPKPSHATLDEYYDYSEFMINEIEKYVETER